MANITIPIFPGRLLSFACTAVAGAAAAIKFSPRNCESTEALLQQHEQLETNAYPMANTLECALTGIVIIL
jgi:hypothetical protein